MKKIEIDNKQAILIICILLGAFIRLYALDRQSFWFDELYSVMSASEQTFKGLFNNWIIHDVHPPLYQVLLFYWAKVFGSSEFAIRALSAIAGILAVIFMYVFSKDLFDENVRINSTIILCFSSSAMYFSQEARSYSILLMFSVVSTIIWLKLLKNIDNSDINKSDFIIYAISAILVSYTHYFGFILILYQLVYLIICSFVSKKSIKKNILLSSIILISVSIWVGFHFLTELQSKLSGNYWIEKPTLMFFVMYFGFVLNPLTLSIPLLIIVPAIVKYKDFFANLKESAKFSLNSPFYALIYLAFFPLISLFIVSMQTPILINKFLIILFPAYYLLIAYWISQNNFFKDYKGILYVIIVSFIMLNVSLRSYYNVLFKQNWRQAIEFIVSNDNENIETFSSGETTNKYSKYYLDMFNEKYNKKVILDNIKNKSLDSIFKNNKNKIVLVLNTKYDMLDKNYFEKLKKLSKNFEFKEFHPEVSVIIFYLK